MKLDEKLGDVNEMSSKTVQALRALQQDHNWWHEPVSEEEIS